MIYPILLVSGLLCAEKKMEVHSSLGNMKITVDAIDSIAFLDVIPEPVLSQYKIEVYEDDGSFESSLMVQYDLKDSIVVNQLADKKSEYLWVSMYPPKEGTIRKFDSLSVEYRSNVALEIGASSWINSDTYIHYVSDKIESSKYTTTVTIPYESLSLLDSKNSNLHIYECNALEIKVHKGELSGMEPIFTIYNVTVFR